MTSRVGPPVVIVSARGPFVTHEGRTMRAPGGVSAALWPLMREANGHWFATGGESAAPDAELNGIRVHAIGLPDALRAAWYYGACNTALWPLSHGFIDRCRFRLSDFKAYQEVNRRVASTLAKHARTGAHVWIHDYQLALVPRLLRDKRRDLKIGVFWHIPFPPSDLFRALPWAQALLLGLTAADVLGFHVERYVRAFTDAAIEQRVGTVHSEISNQVDIAFAERKTRLIACPIGIDVEQWGALSEDPRVAAEARAMRSGFGAKRLLLAVDRLDYSKGVLERLEAFEAALARNAWMRSGVTLIQVGVPSRDTLAPYRSLRCQIEQAIGRINGRFSSHAHVPVRFFARCFSPRELAPFYLAADVAVVTPMRDGMNLVALEYVAMKKDHGGRLLLSTMAGAADILPEAYLVNPYDADGLSTAIEAIATAPHSAEDSERMRALHARATQASVRDWMTTFLSHLGHSSPSLCSSAA